MLLNVVEAAVQLWALQNITEGMVSLAELEKQDPILGRTLKDFVQSINEACRAAYQRFSTCLDDVLTLPTDVDAKKKAAVIEKLRTASDSKWFKEVAGICDDLAAVANTYDAAILKHIDHAQDGQKRHSLQMLLMILHKHEGDLKNDIRASVDGLKIDLADSRIADARARALDIKSEIDRNLTRINGVAAQITGSTQDGANEVLNRAQIAEAALRRPEIVLLLNMAMVLLLMIVGATVLQYVSLLAFPVLTGFVLSAVIVINAFYLRSIEALSEASFLELMKLALLKFFSPLARPQKQNKQDPESPT